MKKLVFGIGNLDRKYEGTRHNVGFEVVDRLGGKTAKWSENKDLKALTAVLDGGHWLLKSELFVNNTGGTVSAARKQGPEIAPSDCLFVCDDVNLEFGKLRLRASGSAGGHHGLESVIRELGEGFPRLRIGIASAAMPKDVTGFVLQKFSAEENERLGKILEKAASVCEAWVRDGFDAARVHLSQLQSTN